MKPLKPMPIRFSEGERELLNELADLMGEEEGAKLEPTTAVRKAVKEALTNRGRTVPEEYFGKNQEGRPKDNPQPRHKRLRVA